MIGEAKSGHPGGSLSAVEILTTLYFDVFQGQDEKGARVGKGILGLDPDKLRSRSCLCNEAVKSHFEEVLRGVYPTEEEAAG